MDFSSLAPLVGLARILGPFRALGLLLSLAILHRQLGTVDGVDHCDVVDAVVYLRLVRIGIVLHNVLDVPSWVGLSVHKVLEGLGRLRRRGEVVDVLHSVRMNTELCLETLVSVVYRPAH